MQVGRWALVRRRFALVRETAESGGIEGETSARSGRAPSQRVDTGNKMVIVKLQGGLGNQLFQYAAGRAVAHRNDVPLKLDIGWFESNLQRKFRLDRFNISATIATHEEVAKSAGLAPARTRQKVWGRLHRRLPYRWRSVIREPHYQFEPKSLLANGNSHLIGYWQSEKYFTDIEDILREELTLKAAPDSDNEAALSRIHQTESVSLHVRRQDYVSNPNQTHALCSPAYYHAATEKLTQEVRQPHFFVFSDDMEWARQRIRLECPVSYVTHNGGNREYEDLRLMSSCKHHIMANSTFSWWGAWLNPNAQKTVVAPRRWFNDPRRDTRDLLPDAWIRV